MNNTTRGRADLLNWEQNKPQNFFTADANLQNVLRYTMGDGLSEAVAGRLLAFGALSATLVDEAAKQEDELANHPRLQRYTHLGERVEQIAFHPNHDVVGAHIWESGILALQAQPGNAVRQMALFYLLEHNGEMGHACSIVCTSGLIRALEQAADATVRDKFLPPLLDPDYRTKQHGAQFLTEVQGGSDVGANAVEARDNGDGTWRISGEKWFCSNINADQFLVMARPAGAAEGTRGLGAFLVPRRLADGATNEFYIRRLKDKLGTRTLASAEVDFREATAYPIGAIDAGFKTTVELVLNTSRLMNAICCAAIMRRAYIEAASYACSRQAFGQTIANYPLVQETTADILAENYAAVASGFALASLLDKIETNQASDNERAVYRLLVNLNKYITSVRGSEMVHRAIEVLGGNGAIETFSILPRLYRDMVVFESWEGTHNVLCLQVWRDIERYQLHIPFIEYLQRLLDPVAHTELQDALKLVQNAVERLPRLIERLATSESMYQQAHCRRLADELAHTAQAALLLAEAQWELESGITSIKADVLTHFVNRHLRRDYDPLEDPDTIQRLQRLMAAY